MPRSPISVAPPAPARPSSMNEHPHSSQPPAYSLAAQGSSIRPPQPSSTLRAHAATPSPASPTQPPQPTPAHAQAFLERWCCGGPGLNGKYNDPATTIAALVRLGANTSLANNWGEPPLFMAAYRGRTAIVEALLQTGASPDCTDKPGRAPLWAACRGGHVGTVEVLLRNEMTKCSKEAVEGAHESEVALEESDQNQENNDAIAVSVKDAGLSCECRLVSALDVCAVFNKIDCARLLVRCLTGRLATAVPPRRINVPALLEHPMHTAARHANSEIIRVWMRHSGSPHSTDGAGVTPLHRVCDNRGQVDTRSLRLIVGATRPRLPPRRTRVRGRSRAWVSAQ